MFLEKKIMYRIKRRKSFLLKKKFGNSTFCYIRIQKNDSKNNLDSQKLL